MNALDTNLQTLCPTVMVPRFEILPDLQVCGHRFLACKDGLWLEARRSWLHARLPVAPSPIPLPYGTPAVAVEFTFGQDLVDLLRLFISESQAAFPKEHAAWLLWNDVERCLEYEPVRILDQGSSHIRYERPADKVGWHPCVDLHSHGIHDAGFSAVDDTDDDDTKLAIVVGNCDRANPTLAARLCLQGTHHDFSEWVEQLLYTDHQVVA
jgi:PRTRC genetic system protein A